MPFLIIFVGGPCLVLGLILAAVELFWLTSVYTQVSDDRLLWWTVVLNLFGSLSGFVMSALVFVPVGILLGVHMPRDGHGPAIAMEVAFVAAIVASYLVAVRVEYGLLRRLQRGHQEIEPARLKRTCRAMNGVTHGVVLLLFLVVTLVFGWP